MYQPGQVRVAAFWAALSSITSVAALPFALELMGSGEPLAPFWVMAVAQVGLTLVLVLPLGLLALLAGRSVGLGSPVVHALLHGGRPRIEPRGLAAAVLAGSLLSVVVLGGIALAAPLVPVENAPAHPGVLASLGASVHAGIFEELILRFVPITLIVWVASKIWRGKPPGYVYVVAILTATALFGAAHIPQAVELGLTGLPAFTVILAGNGLLGIAWGLLLWRFGVEYAMLSHFTANLVIHVAYPALTG